MKFCGLCLLGAGLLAAQPALAQVSAYAEFSVSRFSSNYGPTAPGTDYLYGPTVGVTAKLASLHWLTLSGDIHGEFLGGASSKSFDGIVVGPQISLHVKKFSPYGEFGVGFARYNDGHNTSISKTTDAQIQVNGGIDREFGKRFDWRVFEYSYTQYYANGGNYNPKTFSTGVVFHIGSR